MAELAGPEPVLLVGRGLIGSATARLLRAAGQPVVTVGRGGRPAPGHLPVDLGSAAGRRELAGLLRRRPRCVVLAHGPSDVTWIERHQAAAAAVHVGVAELATAAAAAGVPVVLVSTDNVFDGTAGRRRPADPARPANGYGRVKAEAERLLLAAGDCLVLRVSLVYGWTGSRHRGTYGQRCLQAALAGERLAAPTDQAFTPLHVADVAEVLGALCRARGLPGGPVGRVAHLAGPAELSRYEFAVTAYRLAGADPALVRPCLRRDTEWASRPRYSSLRGDDLGRLATGLAGLRPMSPEVGLRLMLRTAPALAVPA